LEIRLPEKWREKKCWEENARDQPSFKLCHPGTRLPAVRPRPDSAAFSALDAAHGDFLQLVAHPAVARWLDLLSNRGGSLGLFWVVNVRIALCLFCYAENELKDSAQLLSAQRLLKTPVKPRSNNE
jgi:hypothetical protein